MPAQTKHSAHDLIAAWRQFGHAPQASKDRAAFRVDVLREVAKFTRDGMPLMKARELVAGQFRNKGKRGVSAASIAHWQASVEGHHAADWLALLTPHYAGRTAFVRIEPDMWMRFKSDFLRPQCPSAASCYARLRRSAKVSGRVLPHLRTFLRRLDDEMPTWRQTRRNGPQLEQFELFD